MTYWPSAAVTNMLDWLLQVDQNVFVWINTTLANPLFDLAMPWWRSRSLWLSLYALLAIIWAWRFGRRVLPFMVLALIAIGLSDALSSQLIKPMIGRLRPCHEVALVDTLRLLVPCGPSFSFTSSHAANHFCFAWLVGSAFSRLGRWLLPSLLVWAGSIAFGQVYVGVHYPLDILVGALLGLTIGWMCCRAYQKLGYRYPQ